VRTPTADELASLLPMVVERLPRLDAIGAMLDFVFMDDVAVDPVELVPRRWDVATTRAGLAAALEVIESVGEVSFEADELEPALRALAEARGWKVGDLFMAIRVAVTGRTATPPLFDTMMAIGYERSLARLRAAIDRLDDPQLEETEDAPVRA
jgi:glutamyl-tRNA synthetase